jgi:hypothetical protein
MIIPEFAAGIFGSLVLASSQETKLNVAKAIAMFIKKRKITPLRDRRSSQRKD